MSGISTFLEEAQEARALPHEHVRAQPEVMSANQEVALSRHQVCQCHGLCACRTEHVHQLRVSLASLQHNA